jgi:transposase
VRTIRRLADEEANYNDIAQKFGIHKNTVYRIVKRQLWSHI